MAGRIVAASAHGDLQIVDAREVKCRSHVSRPCAPRDHGWSAIDESVEADPRSVVSGIAGAQHRAGQRASQLDWLVVGAPTG
jgi:hypothetical protein